MKRIILLIAIATFLIAPAACLKAANINYARFGAGAIFTASTGYGIWNWREQNKLTQRSNLLKEIGNDKEIQKKVATLKSKLKPIKEKLEEYKKNPKNFPSLSYEDLKFFHDENNKRNGLIFFDNTYNTNFNGHFHKSMSGISDFGVDSAHIPRKTDLDKYIGLLDKAINIVQKILDVLEQEITRSEKRKEKLGDHFYYAGITAAGSLAAFCFLMAKTNLTR